MSIFKRGTNATKKGITRIISDQEEIQILELLRNVEHDGNRFYFPEMADLIEVLVDTGMRMLEAIELTYSDINFEINVIIIRVTKGFNHRRIPMTKRVAAILKRRQTVDQHKPFNLTDIQILHSWIWARGRMGLKFDKGFVLYALRRTCAFRLVNAGIEPDVIQDWLGCSRTSLHGRLAPLPIHKLLHAAEMLERIDQKHSHQ
jgi:integrase